MVNLEAPRALTIEERGPWDLSALQDELSQLKNGDRDKFDAVHDQQPNGQEDSQDAEHDEKMAIFVKWLLDNGGKFPLLELRKYDTEVRGVHAVADIDTDVTIVEVPLRCLILVEMGKDTEVGRAVQAADLDLDAPKHVYLMLYMLVDRRRPDSFFKPYYDILPKTLNTMPIFWQPEELRWLEGSYLLTQVEDRIAAIESDYQAVCDVYPPFQDMSTLEEFKWARMCVCSRNFGLVVDGLRTSAMVPYADMLNHYRPRETKWAYDNDRGGFTITTLQGIKGGAQVYDSYGQKCNHRFLLNYGFALENNVEADGFCPNEIPLELKLDPADPLLARKTGFWRLDQASMVKRIRVCATDNDNWRAALSLLRVMVANVDEWQVIEGGSRFVYGTAKDLRYPLGLRNETAVLRKLHAMVQGMINAYPTTLEEDERKLKEGNLPPFSNHRHAVIHIRGEKVVLHHYKTLAETALQCLAVPEAQAASAWKGKVRHIEDYCVSILGQARTQDRVKQAQAGSRGTMSAGPTVV